MKMFRYSPFVLVASLAFLVPSSASADIPASADGVTYLPIIVVYGRPNRPSVVIEVTRPTPAHEVSIAHEEMRARLWHTASAPPHLLPQ